MVSWTESARLDLRQIYDYIAVKSPHYAQKVIVSIVTKADILETFPLMGRMVPEAMDPSIRELIIYSYRIIYKTSQEGVDILGAIHGKRDFDDAFDIPQTK